MESNRQQEEIDFVVGEERALAEVVTESEIGPLLLGTVRGGASRARLRLPDGETLWSRGAEPLPESLGLESSLTLEGEVVGTLVVEGPREREEALRGLAALLSVAVQTILTNNLKRMLTTEIHTTVVTQSYDELLATNRQLTLSEGRYRDLAASLERKVEERTAELARAHTRLLQQGKLAAVGQLAAGMAHEINNPLGFITSNLNTLKKYVAVLQTMVGHYRATLAQAEVAPQDRESLIQLEKKAKLDFIFSDLEPLIDQSCAGCDRVGKIVADLKGFSHIDESEEVVVDLNQEIDRTLSVLRHQLPADATIVKRYGPLPGFVCNAAEICQVFLGIVQNSIQARPVGLALTIETREESGRIVIRFTDNGPGMSAEVVSRIFEPFFTTKEVGQGMGMGLAVAYEAITAYGGTIEAVSQPGQGTTVVISLPSHRAPVV